MNEQYKHYSMIIQWSDEDNAYVATSLHCYHASIYATVKNLTTYVIILPHTRLHGISALIQAAALRHFLYEVISCFLTSWLDFHVFFSCSSESVVGKLVAVSSLDLLLQ